VSPGVVTGKPARIAIWRAMPPRGHAGRHCQTRDKILDLVRLDSRPGDSMLNDVSAHSGGVVSLKAPDRLFRSAYGRLRR
jgi:hypothetical protein